MKKFYLVLLTVLSTTIYAQDVNLNWANSIGGTFVDEGFAITTDAAGNVYVTGSYQVTVDFDPGVNNFNLTSNGLADIFIQKLDGGGNFVWAKSMGSTSFDAGLSITTDTSGNVYVVGYYSDTVDFDPGVNTFDLTSNGGLDVFIQKLDVNGNFIWAKSMGGVSFDYGYSITTDASDNVYVAGSFQDTVDFDPSVNTFNLTSNGNADVFIQKLDANGNFVWAKSAGGTSIDKANSITNDATGNVYVTGSYFGTVDFDPGANTFDLTSNGASDVFIQKLDAGGNFIWAKSMGGTISDEGASITSDASSNVYVIGDYFDTVDFDPGADTFDLTSNGITDIFIIKLDAGGNFIWANSMGGISFDRGFSITSDASGNTYATGFFQDTTDFDPSANTFNLTSNGLGDIFIQKLDAGGNFIWAKSIGGTGFEGGNSVAKDASGSVYTTGFFQDTADFDPGTGILNLTSNGSRDVFIQKLNQQCAVDVSVTITDPSITANATGASYQWLDCNDSNAVITGETAQNFTASVNGDYAVEVTENACTDTSVCITISTIGIERNTLFNGVSIFPNPNDGIVNIDLGNLKGVSIHVFSVSGQLIYHRENITNATHQFELRAGPGIYSIELSAQGEKQLYKLVKK